MSEYYFHDGITQRGPYNIDDFIKLPLKKDTKVWKEGMEDWKNADEVEELKSIFIKAVPPPIKKEEPKTSPPIKKNQKETKKSFTGTIITVLVVVLAIVVCLVAYNKQQQDIPNEFYNEAPVETYEEKKLSLEEQEKLSPEQFLTGEISYRENLGGGKFVIDISIRSTATVAVYKDIRIQYTFKTRTDTEIKTANYVYYYVVKPGETVQISDRVEKPRTAAKLEFTILGALPVN